MRLFLIVGYIFLSYIKSAQWYLPMYQILLFKSYYCFLKPAIGKIGPSWNIIHGGPVEKIK